MSMIFPSACSPSTAWRKRWCDGMVQASVCLVGLVFLAGRWYQQKSSIVHLCAIQCHAVGTLTHSLLLWFPSWEAPILALRDLLRRVLWGGRLRSLGSAQQHTAAKKKTRRKQFPVAKCCLKGFSEGVLWGHMTLKGLLYCHLGVNSNACHSVSAVMPV